MLLCLFMICAKPLTDSSLNFLYQVELCTVDGLVKESTQCAPNGYYFIPVYDKVSLCFLFALVLDCLLCVLILFTYTYIIILIFSPIVTKINFISVIYACRFCHHRVRSWSELRGPRDGHGSLKL
jgi:hypothetical protein